MESRECLRKCFAGAGKKAEEEPQSKNIPLWGFEHLHDYIQYFDLPKSSGNDIKIVPSSGGLLSIGNKITFKPFWTQDFDGYKSWSIKNFQLTMLKPKKLSKRWTQMDNVPPWLPHPSTRCAPGAVRWLWSDPPRSWPGPGGFSERRWAAKKDQNNTFQEINMLISMTIYIYINASVPATPPPPPMVLVPPSHYTPLWWGYVMRKGEQDVVSV